MSHTLGFTSHGKFTPFAEMRCPGALGQIPAQAVRLAQFRPTHALSLGCDTPPGTRDVPSTHRRSPRSSHSRFPPPCTKPDITAGHRDANYMDGEELRCLSHAVALLRPRVAWALLRPPSHRGPRLPCALSRAPSTCCRHPSPP